MFDLKIWDRKKAASGHMILKNKVTQTVINVGVHEGLIDAGAVMCTVKKIQEHIDKLSKFGVSFKAKDWKEKFDIESFVKAEVKKK